MTPANQLLDRLPRTVLVVGKGGVGKTTCAAGLAALFARRGERTLLLSTDPAAALATVIGEPVATRAAPLSGEANLDAQHLDAAELRQAFLERWRDTIAEIVDRGTYLDREDVDGLVDAALPGADEVFALLALGDILGDPASSYVHIVVDTAPTGHTLRLLALPATFSALVSMLEQMQGKHRFMVRALTHRYRRDRADDFIDHMRTRIDVLRALLANSRELAALVVSRPESLVVAETDRYIESLRGLHIDVAAVVMNAVPKDYRGELLPAGDAPTTYWVPRLSELPQGLAAVATAVARASRVYPGVHEPVNVVLSTPPAVHQNDILHILRQLTIVGGKGGVGKSTVACALALAAAVTVADEDSDASPTLLVSTDPAASIADAFGAADAGWARADVEHRMESMPGLVVRQMDASAAFARINDQYRDRVDALFDRIVSRGVDVERDRAILRDLFALAPPGIDELFALSILGDALAEQRFARIVVDPAPTGHLLRLLDMPAVALDWTHRLMRLLLKYRDVVGLGEAAQELLEFAQRTRALDALLHDPDRTALVLVLLDEPVVRSETERLIAAVRDRSIGLSAVVWNRVRLAPAPLPAAANVRQVFAQEVVPPPIGSAALRTWTRSWSDVPPIT